VCKALAIVLSDGVRLETFHTPPGRLEHLVRGEPTPAALPEAVPHSAEAPRS